MTIYALSSGPGVSGVAIIRISGPDASKAITLLTGKSLPSPRVASLRKINNINTSELIDQGIIIWFPGPESYTGEDMAEIHVHGGKAVVLTLQNELSKIENFRLAEPGEFTKIAFQNGKINLLQAESIADLISAETEIQRLQAVKTMKGKSAEKFNNFSLKPLNFSADLPFIIFTACNLCISVSAEIKSAILSAFNKLYLFELLPDIIFIACCLCISVSDEIKSDIASAFNKFIFPF